MDRIHVLAIAPYDKLTEVFRHSAEMYPEIDLDLITGNLEESIERYVQYSSRHYDLLISRGGTASLLKKRLNLPVFEIKVSASDMLRAVRLATQTGYDFAVVGFSNITEICHTLSEILQYNLNIHEIQSADELPSLLEQLRNDGIHLIVGDVATVQAAEAAGLQNILIVSSAMSIEQSFKDVLDFWDNMKNVMNRERLFRSIADQDDHGILVVDENDRILFSNDVYARYDLGGIYHEFVQPHGMFANDTEDLHLQKVLNHVLYSIRVNTVQLPEKAWIYSFRRHGDLTDLDPCVSVEELDTARANVIFSDSEFIRPVLPMIRQACNTFLPVLINGQAGTEKSAIARYIHSNSTLKNGAFVQFQSGALSEASWDRMTADPDSVLYMTGCSFFFEHIHLLSMHMQIRICKTLKDLLRVNRLRIFATSTTDLAQAVAEGAFLRELYELINGICITMPSLNQRRADIPALAAIYINQFNAEFTREVIGFKNGAISLLQDFNWTLNVDQFRSVIRQLVFESKGFYITKEETESVLQASQHTFAEQSEEFYHGTLDEIEKKIIEEVLRRENMNQTATAKKLGISRSTLWRKLGKS